MAPLSKPQFQHNTNEIICALGFYILFSSFQCITILPSYTQHELERQRLILTFKPLPSTTAPGTVVCRWHLF